MRLTYLIYIWRYWTVSNDTFLDLCYRIKGSICVILDRYVVHGSEWRSPIDKVDNIFYTDLANFDIVHKEIEGLGLAVDWLTIAVVEGWKSRFWYYTVFVNGYP